MYGDLSLDGCNISKKYLKLFYIPLLKLLFLKKDKSTSDTHYNFCFKNIHLMVVLANKI